MNVCDKKPANCSDENPGAAQRRLLVQTGHGNGFTEGELLYGKLIYDQPETPDTWEVELSKNGEQRQQLAASARREEARCSGLPATCET